MLTIELRQLDEAISKTQEYLLSRQNKKGYWVGILEADATVVSGFIPLLRFLNIRDEEFEKKAINYIFKRQNDDGSWSTFYKGPGNINATVQTYFGLKMCGITAQDERMKKAKEFVLKCGGIEETNTFTKIMIALFGQYAWKGLPEIPPEFIFLPKWFFINIYECASWTRATIMALCIILALKPVHRLEKGEEIFELYGDIDKFNNPKKFKAKKFFSYGNLLLIFNSFFKIWDKLPAKIGRDKALKKVQEWIIDRQEDDGSWGGIMLPWLYSLVAFKALGYPNAHPVMKKGISGLKDFIVESEKEVLLQPAVSPVWDTAWSMHALLSSGIDPENEALKKGADWLLSKQINIAGDWIIRNPKVEPGCWSFEFENKWYPDFDDTSVVASVLNEIRIKDEDKKNEAIKKGLNWVLSMQNKDGSWAAFDKDNYNILLENLPYADFITPLDFGSPDITANVLMFLSKFGYDRKTKPVEHAVNYLKKSQKADGSWYGRWGVTYLYGTSKVLLAFESIGALKDNDLVDAIEKGRKWLRDIQNADGGWGESCMSFEMDSYQPLNDSTASQTAWALLGLLSLGNIDGSVNNGIDYLINTQKSDGSWDEDYFTGGGFPKAFYLKYEFYKIYFPLMALSKYKNLKGT
jgi:squalene-hopene/tetraprenyl-beta-curcumene cyclase